MKVTPLRILLGLVVLILVASVFHGLLFGTSREPAQPPRVITGDMRAREEAGRKEWERQEIRRRFKGLSAEFLAEVDKIPDDPAYSDWLEVDRLTGRFKRDFVHLASLAGQLRPYVEKYPHYSILDRYEESIDAWRDPTKDDDARWKNLGDGLATLRRDLLRAIFEKILLREFKPLEVSLDSVKRFAEQHGFRHRESKSTPGMETYTFAADSKSDTYMGGKPRQKLIKPWASVNMVDGGGVFHGYIVPLQIPYDQERGLMSESKDTMRAYNLSVAQTQVGACLTDLTKKFLKLLAPKEAARVIAEIERVSSLESGEFRKLDLKPEGYSEWEYEFVEGDVLAEVRFMFGNLHVGIESKSSHDVATILKALDR